jgi:hypothetical protein
LNVIDIQRLGPSFAEHAASCASSRILCKVHVAFEAWIRLELAQVLQHLGNISFDCAYGGSACKGDLLLDVDGQRVGFELKSFVNGADANKFDKFPRQLELLKSEVLGGGIAQGVAICTFVGYRDTKMALLCQKWFPQPWETTSLLSIHADQPLRLTLASIGS